MPKSKPNLTSDPGERPDQDIAGIKQEVGALCAQFGQPERYGPEADEPARPAQ